MAAPDERTSRLNQWKKRERIILLPLLLVAVGAFFTMGRVEVLGHSMDPTLHNGQRLIVLRSYKLLGPLKVGDVVVIEPGAGTNRDAQVIKRIAFLQNAEGTLPWPEKMPTLRGLTPTNDLFEGDVLSRPVVKNGIIVLGDNINNSMDSRDFGPVFAREIYGRVFVP